MYSFVSLYATAIRKHVFAAYLQSYVEVDTTVWQNFPICRPFFNEKADIFIK